MACVNFGGAMLLETPLAGAPRVTTTVTWKLPAAESPLGRLVPRNRRPDDTEAISLAAPTAKTLDVSRSPMRASRAPRPASFTGRVRTRSLHPRGRPSGPLGADDEKRSVPVAEI